MRNKGRVIFKFSGSEEKLSKESLYYTMINIVVPIVATGFLILIIVIAILCFVAKRGKRTYNGMSFYFHFSACTFRYSSFSEMVI